MHHRHQLPVCMRPVIAHHNVDALSLQRNHTPETPWLQLISSFSCQNTTRCGSRLSNRSEKLSALRRFICNSSPGGGKFDFSPADKTSYDELVSSYKEAVDQLKLLEFKKRSAVSLKLRRLCRTKDRGASKEFWRSIKGERAKSVELNAVSYTHLTLPTKA